MRNLAVGFVIASMFPAVSSAAALTSEQANSLIKVVQSSPGTPASVFVPLITSFSSVTTSQAASLITVVQAAPGVPANAFVGLLISFTDDTPAAQPATTTPAAQSQAEQPAPSAATSTQPVNNLPAGEPPAVQLPADTAPPQLDSFEITRYPERKPPDDVNASEGYYLRLWANELLDLPNTVVQQGITLGTITHDGTRESDISSSSSLDKIYYQEVGLIGVHQNRAFQFTVRDLAGNEFTVQTKVK